AGTDAAERISQYLWQHTPAPGMALMAASLLAPAKTGIPRGQRSLLEQRLASDHAAACSASGVKLAVHDAAGQWARRIVEYADAVAASEGQRNGLTHWRELASMAMGSDGAYASLLERVASDVLGGGRCADLEHAEQGAAIAAANLLKGFGRRFLAGDGPKTDVSRQSAAEAAGAARAVVVFVVGGVTFDEAARVAAVARRLGGERCVLAQSLARLGATPSSTLATAALRAALLHTLKPRQSSAAAATAVSGGDSAAGSAAATAAAAAQAFAPLDTFLRRHNGPRDSDVAAMLQALGFQSLDEMISATVPDSIRLDAPLHIADGEYAEKELLAKLKAIAQKNKTYRSFIGTGYTDVVVPPVILRNILENPGWYTQYTPYQPEISQGRLESLLNFQTVVSDLTGLPAANASLLDEGTAAGEALVVCLGSSRKKTRNVFFADENCHPQTLAVLRTRAEGFDAEIVVGDYRTFDFAALGDRLAGALVSYPDTYGNIGEHKALADQVHAQGAQLVVVADLMSLAVLQPPAEFGADIAIGNTQRFGVPLGYGGPHAAFFATTTANQRRIPGRIIGVSRDAEGNRAYRLALQTREQHIRREKASSNICTAQALLANMAAMYAVYHGPEGVRAIADRIHRFTQVLATSVSAAGHTVENSSFFDTLRIRIAANSSAAEIHARADERQINLRRIDAQTVGITLDEAITREELALLVEVFGGDVAAIDSVVAATAPMVAESAA
ncbi:glycine decarboxylase subunit P, partial [Coemansia sp. RSA 2704]